MNTQYPPTIIYLFAVSAHHYLLCIHRDKFEVHSSSLLCVLLCDSRLDLPFKLMALAT